MKKRLEGHEATKVLLEVSRVVSSSLELDETSSLVLSETTKALGADHAALFLFDEESGHLLLTKVKGFSKNEADNIKLLASWEIINDQVTKRKKSLVVNDVERDPIFKTKRIPASKERLPVKSFLAAPLVKDDKIIGVLIASNRTRPGHLFTKEDAELLSTLSNEVAIALANARLFEQLSVAQAEAAQSEKMAVIGTLSAGINHEISNPLGIARGQCQAFILNMNEGLYKDKTPDELVAKAKEIMDTVMQQVDRATTITKRLSSFARPAKGEAEEVVVEKEVDEVLGLVGYELKFDKIEVEKRITPDLPNIRVDKKQIEEALFNLIRNAGQAIGENGRITISADLKKNNVVIDIRDTGSGIPPDKVKQLFRPFFTTKGPGKGTGLGLFIIQKIIEKNGGRIYLKKTKVGEGTTFTIEFPAAPKAAVGQV